METLDRRVRVVWFLGALVAAVVLGGGAFAVHRFFVRIGEWTGVLLFAVAVVGGVLYVIRRYRAWRFDIQDDALYIERGVITRVKTVVPFVRVQHVDTQRGPVERLIGLSSVVVYTAGTRGADVTIPGLSEGRADRLQARLRDLAVESEYEDAV